VVFADGHRSYAQVKESIRVGQRPWLKLWKDFDAEFHGEAFHRGRDRLFLCVGEVRDEHQALKGLCERAAESLSYDEWWCRLTAPQRSLVEKIGSARGRLSDQAETLAYFGHIDVEMWPLEHIERDRVPYWMPTSNKPRASLFSLLRDRAGGKARRRGWFTSAPLRESLRTKDEVLIDTPPPVDDLKESVRSCGALLKQHKCTMGDTGLHLRRGVVDEIVEWAAEETHETSLAVLLDGAGMGKTVVMRDVLCRLEDAGICVLAVKADQQLSGIATHEDLRGRLDLPESVERVVSRLAALGRAVVLVDQVDALSLSMARDQRALNVVIEMVARLRTVPGVRVLFSCRAFDLSNDPRLERIEVSRRFDLPQLSDEEVEGVLEAQGLIAADLSPATRQLLRTPLHLDLFSRVLPTPGRSPGSETDGFDVSTLQELYALLWRVVVLSRSPSSPPLSEREEVLRLLADRMDREQRTSVPRSIFTTAENEHLESAANWLASAGILVPSVNEWSFLHQTFFDYCHARRFVEERRSLSGSVLSGDQGLHARPQLVQVLSYLRGSGDRSYLRELQDLACAKGLRVHLRLLLLGWFGALHDPTENEWLVARRLLANPTLKSKLLTAMGGNASWFAHMKGGWIQDMLARDDELLDTEVIPYLISMIDVEQEAVVEIVEPFAGRTDRWNHRLRFMLSQIRKWYAPSAVRLFERMLRETPMSELGRLYEFDDVVKALPKDGCRLIRIVLDRMLEGFEANGDSFSWYDRDPFNSFPLRDHDFDETVKAASDAEPRLFVEHVLPWLERTVRVSGEPESDGPYFSRDGLSSGWYGRVGSFWGSLVRSLASALSSLALTEPEEFRKTAARLADLPYQTPQQLLCEVYRKVPGPYAEDALHFLLGDTRRLELGYSQQYDTRQLIKAVYPFLSGDQRAELEDYVLSYSPVFRYLGTKGLKWRGMEQMYLLQEIPAEHLSERGARRLGELERKFPGRKASPVDPSPSLIADWTEPPISPTPAERMSDKAWLRAMSKYSGATRHKDRRKGGAYQLRDVLLRRVKAEPERFYALALRVPPDVDVNYAEALVRGLAESSGPDEWLFEVVKRFADQLEGDLERDMAWALEKRAEGGLSDEILDLLEGTARGSVSEYEKSWEDSGHGPHGAYINSERGASLQTLVRALRARDSAEAKERVWELLEFASNEPSAPMRSGAVWELLLLLEEDRERALSLFEQTVEGHPGLLCSHPTPDFLYHGSYKCFSRVVPFIAKMMECDDEECRRRGAELACVASLSSAEALGSEDALELAKQLAEEAADGTPPLRRGAARVYANNLSGRMAAHCASALLRFLDDEDERVRDAVSEAFDHAHGTFAPVLREFVESFAASRALHDGAREFAEYLWRHGPEYPNWSLSVLETALDNAPEEGSLRTHAGDRLVKLVLRIYTDQTADDALRSRAMDVFDRLMERHTYEAQRALAEWDRR
jgi:hypothetical protein